MTTQHAQISNWRDELIPNIVDHLARVTPDAPYALFPNSPITYDQGYRTVNYKDFANAINGFAWWLHETLGPSKDFEVLAYVGPNDVRYTALILGAIKAGYVAFLTSPRNSDAAYLALFEALQCGTILTSNPTPPPVEHMLKSRTMKHLHVPSVADLLDKSHAHYPFTKTYDTARWEPWCIIHTSGSTGIPKPLIWSHETAQRHSKYIALDPPLGFDTLERRFQGKRILNTFPPFHGAGIEPYLINAVCFGSLPIAPISGAIPSGEGIVAALEQTTADVAFLIPAIMADLAQKPDLLEYCFRNLNFIFFAGGDLPQPLGDKIAAKIPIMSQYGSSEIGLALQLLAPPNKDADWRWVRFHPELGFDFEKITPGTFELVVKKDPRYEQYQMPFTISPGLKDLQEYRSRDLFVKHPSLPDTWSWRARADDIIVFLNGEKTNPVSMEQHIVVSNVEVTSALVFGMQQFQAGLLIETAEPFSRPIATKASALIDKIWPSIEKANMDAPAHARVEKSMIIFTSPDKPMIRSSKGTIQRQGTVVSYAEDIEETYRKADDALIHGAKSRIDTTNPEAVTDFIKQAIASINPDLLEDDKKSFFTLGLDSLMAMRLSRALKFGLGKLDLSASVIYNHPTVRQLVNHVIEKKRTSSTKAEAQQKAELETMVTELENLIQQIPTYNRTFRTAEESINEIVVLTGSTSSLGAHLLQALLETPRVNHVYCLDRNPNAGDVYRKKASLSGFPFQNHGDRVTFLHATLDKPNLGLEETIYEMLRSNVTLIIHNAWTVNFVIPLRTFRSQFDGMVNLFRLASTPTRHNSPRLLYISSISSVARFSSITGDDSIPETVIRNGSAAYQIGYARSKLLAELLCDAAARHLLLPIAFARVGQIAGPVGDANAQAWNIAEWFPSLVLTSISMGSLPDDFGVEANEIEWMPVDILAESLVELGLRHDGEAQLANAGAEAFNVNNPHSTTWKSLLPHVLTAIEKHFGKRVETIALTAWLEKLQDVVQSFSAERTDVAQTHPAIKLVDFYKGHFLNQSAPLKWDIHRATERSVVLRTMPAVGVEWIEKWVKEWAS